MGTAGAHTDRGLALSQQTPLLVSIDQDAALVENSIQKERRPSLYPLQVGDINPATAEVLQADSKPGYRQRTIAGEQDQQVEIRARILVASRERAVENSKTNAMLGPQRAAQTGEERPMGTEILALTRCKSQLSRSTPGGA